MASARHVACARARPRSPPADCRAMTASTSISSSVTPRYSIAERGIDFQVAHLAAVSCASVRLDEADHDVHAAAPEIMRLVEHAVRLAHAGGRSDIELELSALAPRDEIDEITPRLDAIRVHSALNTLSIHRQVSLGCALQLHEQRQVQPRFVLAQVRHESRNQRIRRAVVAANWRNATGASEVRHARSAAIKLCPERRVLVRHVVYGDGSVPRVEGVTGVGAEVG